MRQQHIPPETANQGGEGGRTRPSISIAGRRVPMPRSRLARIVVGGLFVLFGLFGFLPVLGFWMIPVGLVVLSYDVAAIRRLRRRLEVWWHRRKMKKHGDQTS